MGFEVRSDTKGWDKEQCLAELVGKVRSDVRGDGDVVDIVRLTRGRTAGG